MSHATPPGRDPLTAAQGLTRALDTMSERLEQVQKDSIARDKRLGTYGRHNRVFVLFDVALTVLLTFFGFVSVRAASQAHSATVDAAAQHASLISACQAGNLQRAEQIQLWQFVIHLSKRPKTAAQRKVTAEFQAYLHRTFAPRDCARIYATPGPGK